MRLGSKIFLSSALVIVVLTGVGFLSLRAVGRLVSVNREITTRAVPVVRLTASAREAIPPLVRLEARAVVLGDTGYATAWTERAARLAQDLQSLAEYAQTEQETLHLRRASAAFKAYRRIVAEEHALLRRGDSARAMRLSDSDARSRAEEVQANLDGLMAATHTRILAAQTEAGRLEARTWTAVLVALGAAVCLALLGTAVIARRMTRSLGRLSSATAAVAAGAFREPIAVEGRDEIGALATSFNRMTSQLGRQFSALAMRGEISIALNRNQKLEEILQRAAELLVQHLDLALACVWTLNRDDKTLELQASAGTSTRLEETHRRVILGRSAIGLIAEERRPHATDSLLEDPRVSDKAWAEREGLVAFVGHPLIVEDRLVGVVAAFARAPIDGVALRGFASAAGEIAQCIARKRVEQALHGSEEQIRQLQKIEAVGRLAGGLAHDFNNLLTVISGHSQLLLRRLPPGDPLCSGLDIIERTAACAARLTTQLLAFSRKQILAPAVLDLNDVVPGMAEMLQRLIGEDVNLMFKPAPRLGRVAVDPGQFAQVIVNLVVNARDAMPNGGQISVETANVEVSENSALGHVGASPGSYVMLVVSDTGTGMDAETQARIFEPFFTTKELGKGTGLGLATVYGIVKQSGGNVWVESEPGKGSTFRIYLPRVEGVPEQVVEAVSPLPARGSETILVVEDQNEVRALVQRILEDWGYVVLSAGQTADAFRIVERHSGPIHLLLTDMVMPQMNGAVLAERLVSLRPDMAVLYMSGYTDYASVNHGRFIQKPFAPDALARKVRGVLDSRTGSERADALGRAPRSGGVARRTRRLDPATSGPSLGNARRRTRGTRSGAAASPDNRQAGHPPRAGKT
jgi:signal transduction histidine kinase